MKSWKLKIIGCGLLLHLLHFISKGPWMSYGKTDFNFQGNAGETGGFDHLRSSLNEEIVFGMATCRLFWEALDF